MPVSPIFVLSDSDKIIKVFVNLALIKYLIPTDVIELLSKYKQFNLLKNPFVIWFNPSSPILLLFKFKDSSKFNNLYWHK